MEINKYTLILTCNNQPGIVSFVSKFIFDAGGDIHEAHQFDDPNTSRFFMRVGFTCNKLDETLNTLREKFIPIVEKFSLMWKLHDCSQRKRVLIMVSKLDHCLVDLLYRWRIGELPMDIVSIISNHSRNVFKNIDFGEIPYHHIPITASNKIEQEKNLLHLVDSLQVDLVVLARYMQILSDDLSIKLSGRCINVHHSFLPSFKGAKPYHQAHARGIKLIGATAHFVTNNLDEGPIIEQDVARVSHSDSIEDLVRKGRDLERAVLSRALRYYTNDRILINGDKSVVFPD